MRRTVLSMLALAALVCSCAKEQTPDVDGADVKPEYAELVVSIAQEPATKATSAITVAGGYETAVKDLAIALFDTDGTLAAYDKVPGSQSKTFTVRTGRKYTACCVVNGPDISNKTTIASIKDVAARLGDYNSTGTSGDMVMYGEKTMTDNLDESHRTLSVTVRRLVCRVHLKSCTITPPSGVSASFNNCFISNVATNCSLGGTVTLNSTSGNCSNWYGRSDYTQQSYIINGGTYKAFPEDLTYSGAAPTGSNDYFYSYANANADAVIGWKSTWSATATRLVVTATWAGTMYYYPVAIPNTTANTTYDVTMTITGPGITDPQGEVPSNTNLQVDVTVDPWTGGNEYNGNY